MKIFLDAIQLSLDTSNWLSALTLSLTIPDIAGRIEYNTTKTGERYINWFDRYVAPKYTKGSHIFLTGNDCYALRCSFLHEGNSDISNQYAKKIHDHFKFLEPNENFSMHCNVFKNILQLQIDLFAKDIIESCNQWLVDISSDSSKLEEMENLFSFLDIGKPNNFIIMQ